MRLGYEILPPPPIPSDGVRVEDGAIIPTGTTTRPETESHCEPGVTAPLFLGTDDADYAIGRVDSRAPFGQTPITPTSPPVSSTIKHEGSGLPEVVQWGWGIRWTCEDIVPSSTV